MIRAYTDGACRVSNPGICSCAFVVYDDDVVMKEAKFYLGPEKHTNNFAEYQGLLNLLRWAFDSVVESMLIHCDSLLVVKQVNEEWATRADLEKLTFEARGYMALGKHTLKHIRGHQGIVGNERADLLCNEILDEVCPRTKKPRKVEEELVDKWA